MDLIMAEIEKAIVQEKAPEELVNKKRYTSQRNIGTTSHTTPTSEHKGVTTKLLMKPKMKDDIQEIKDTCFPCLRRNTHLKSNAPRRDI